VHDPRSTKPRSLFVDPGGPGASAVAFLASSYPAFHRLSAHFDLIAVDPRGTTFSDPVRCVSDRERDKLVSAAPDPTTAAGFRRAQRLAADFARGCRQAAGPALRFYDTVTTARDMDRVRAALGLPALDYLGFSYGTELGAAYAHLFPRRTGALVLDGAVDPLLSGVDLLTQQMQGFEAAFDQFAAWCRRHSPCSTLDDPRRAAEQILAAAAREPIPTGQPRRLTATLADIGMAEALYAQALWPGLATALVQARAGSGAGLLALADEYYQRRSDGSYSNLFDAYNVIWCNDSPPGPSDERLRATVQSWARRFPIFGKWSALQLFMCQRWPVPSTVLPRPSAATPSKVLVLGNLHDPATPYRGAKDLARAMGNAEVLTWNGEGHTSYLQGSRCIDRYVDDYLISAELPPEGTVCRT
jgi:pimeloyl-ACP methyl ester carboxylesterase